MSRWLDTDEPGGSITSVLNYVPDEYIQSIEYHLSASEIRYTGQDDEVKSIPLYKPPETILTATSSAQNTDTNTDTNTLSMTTIPSTGTVIASTSENNSDNNGDDASGVITGAPEFYMSFKRRSHGCRPGLFIYIYTGGARILHQFCLRFRRHPHGCRPEQSIDRYASCASRQNPSCYC